VLSRWLEKVVKINSQLARREEEILELVQKTRSCSSGKPLPQAQPPPPPAVVTELESILRMPLAALEKELMLSRKEFRQLLDTIAVTVSESQRIERDIIAIEERKLAGDIYIREEG
jgi:septal ring factor EnvC (AmiA/AmiB activator)